jgi:hypothetical protein
MNARAVPQGRDDGIVQFQLEQIWQARPCASRSEFRERPDLHAANGAPKSPIDISDVSTRSSMDVMVFSSEWPVSSSWAP